jgi:opacity protein-like surface antigen
VTARLLAAALALVLAVPALAAARHRYDGRTAQGTPISFVVSADGRRIDRITLGYYAACDAEIALARSETRTTSAPVTHGGVFTVRVGTAVTVRGRIAGARASGTMRVRFSGCTSPAVPWTARG